MQLSPGLLKNHRPKLLLAFSLPGMHLIHENKILACVQNDLTHTHKQKYKRANTHTFTHRVHLRASKDGLPPRSNFFTRNAIIHNHSRPFSVYEELDSVQSYISVIFDAHILQKHIVAACCAPGYSSEIIAVAKTALQVIVLVSDNYNYPFTKGWTHSLALALTLLTYLLY
jgi:hypothetical protein